MSAIVQPQSAPPLERAIAAGWLALEQTRAKRLQQAGGVRPRLPSAIRELQVPDFSSDRIKVPQLSVPKRGVTGTADINAVVAAFKTEISNMAAEAEGSASRSSRAQAAVAAEAAAIASANALRDALAQSAADREACARVEGELLAARRAESTARTRSTVDRTSLPARPAEGASSK